MIINIIAAMAPNRVIGNQNALPWSYPEDLKHFKAITSGHTIVMGRNTYLSIGRPLPNRRNIVLTSQKIEGVECFGSIDEMLNKLKSEGVGEIFIIGGMRIYQQFIDQADYIYLTQIKKEYEGDTFFPVFEDKFQEVEREVHDEMDFVKFRKIS